jgi:hypothetical protein
MQMHELPIAAILNSKVELYVTQHIGYLLSCCCQIDTAAIHKAASVESVIYSKRAFMLFVQK